MVASVVTTLGSDFKFFKNSNTLVTHNSALETLRCLSEIAYWTDSMMPSIIYSKKKETDSKRKKHYVANTKVMRYSTNKKIKLKKRYLALKSTAKPQV
jgi:hypothetical protein